MALKGLPTQANLDKAQARLDELDAAYEACDCEACNGADARCEALEAWNKQYWRVRDMRRRMGR